jgi:hypothetical protein
MPGEPVTEPEDEPDFQQSLKDNLYFTIRGTEEKGSIRLDKTLFNFIYDIAGTCTDPNETPDYYNNPRAMFVALDLIYKALDETERSENAKAWEKQKQKQKLLVSKTSENEKK